MEKTTYTIFMKNCYNHNFNFYTEPEALKKTPDFKQI